MVLTWENPAAKRFNVTTSRRHVINLLLFGSDSFSPPALNVHAHTLRKTNLPALNYGKPLKPRTQRRTAPLSSTRTPLAAVNFSAFRQVA